MIGGCTVPPPPDPNEPVTSGRVITPSAYMGPMKALSDALNDRVAHRQISDKEARQVISNYAARILADVQIDKVKPEEAWQYGDMFRTARKWTEAKKLLQVAVEHARKNNQGDRRINDSLRLAHVLGELGEVSAAVEAARSTFDAPDEGAAPILPAILLELVPAGLGKGRDIELAKLLEEAIPQHVRTIVDPETDAGKAFELARAHHIRNAWAKVLEIYLKAQREDLFNAARKKALEMTGSYKRV
jgi:hypothetical protein